MAAPGALNLITDVDGLAVGHAHDLRARTGVTVILPDVATIAGVDVRGGGPGTRETDALAADTLVEGLDALVLAGGSVYGLAAADGVVAWLGAQGRGYGLAARAPPAPVVPAAILYDLGIGDKAWGLEPPYRALGVAAAKAAGRRFDLGSVGAGAGARAGALKGGVGAASIVTADFTVGALAAVNSFGSAVAADGRRFWAAPFEIGAEFGGLGVCGQVSAPEDWGLAKSALRQNTTLGVVATDAILTPAEARRVAIMAQDGLARALRPVHTPYDGDVVFVLATGRRGLIEPRPLALTRLGALAADVLARAIARGVYEATTVPADGVPAWRDIR
ncbi:MAG TPA: P1 family peptidase [Caulobacteraceae bacterium]|jgi:L-aminopeptidase/D-esterase-like protein